MKKFLLAATCAVLVIAVAPRSLALPSLAHAGSDPVLARTSGSIEFPREYVPADATLVAHFDLLQFQRTELWKLVQPHTGDFELDEIRSELGFDPLDEVHSVTIWGTEGEAEAAVIIMSDAIDRAMTDLESRGKLEYFREDGLDLFSVEDAVGYVGNHGRRDRVVVMADSTRAAVDAARVIRGDERSLSDDPSSLSVSPVNGSYLFVAANGVLPGMDDFEPASQILGSAQGVQFDLGEAGGSLFAHLSIDTGSVEMARDVSEMVQGLLALARIAIRTGEDVPEGIDELLYSLAVRSRGGAVSVDFEYSVDSLFRILEGLED